MTEETAEPITDEDELDGCLHGQGVVIEEETLDEDLPVTEGGVA